MKFRAIAWVAAAVFLPSAHAIDYNWDSHADTETFVRNLGKNITFTDDARYLLTPLQSRTTGVQATFQLTKGTIGGLKVDFYGDYYGPDKYLGSFVGDLSKGPLTFSFEHLDDRKKYYYLITGTAGSMGASYTLTSNLVADSALGGIAAPVPEPASYAMFALGAVLLPLARRMRQRRAAK